jgi:hypothetical protein
LSPSNPSGLRFLLLERRPSFPLPVATYLIGPLLVQRVGVIPLALGGSVLVQADWALSSAENSVRLVC